MLAARNSTVHQFSREGVAWVVACEISRGLGDLRADDQVDGPSH